MPATDPACFGLPPEIFFDFERTPYTAALSRARSYCDSCPVRGACLAMAMDAEKTDGLDYRAGIFAGMTPQQRHSLWKRGQSLRCEECGVRYDPTLLRQGTLHCACPTDKHIAPLPDRGDQWTDRHTKLARMTIVWLSENVEVGGNVPDALTLSRKLKVSVKDLRRVYQALIEDHVILKQKGLLRRRKSAASANWTPPHLRDGTVA